IALMFRAEVRYVRPHDGVFIAFSVIGDGPVTIAFVSPMVSHLEVAWEEPALEHFMSGLATCGRVLLFDRRGTGLSDRSTASGERLALPQMATDIKAVLESSGTQTAVLFGVTLGCQIAVQFAVDYPDRTQALVLAGGFAKLTRWRDFDFEADPGRVDAWADHAARVWGTGELLGAHAPAMRDSARYRDWAARLERHT